jgi:hypothetical protein
MQRATRRVSRVSVCGPGASEGSVESVVWICWISERRQWADVSRAVGVRGGVRVVGGVCVMGLELHLSMGFAVFWSDRVILYR